MPTLKNLLDLIQQHSTTKGIAFSDDFAREMEMEIRKRWPSEHVYIPQADSRKDPARGELIRQLAARLPTSVIAEHYGISRQLVSYHTRKR
jgi:hypothetical protein